MGPPSERVCLPITPYLDDFGEPRRVTAGGAAGKGRRPLDQPLLWIGERGIESVPAVPFAGAVAALPFSQAEILELRQNAKIVRSAYHETRRYETPALGRAAW
jgi:hypothetical protein